MRAHWALQRGFVVLIVPIALVCLLFPAAQLFLQDDSGMIDDTRAWFGAGTAEGVPEVSEVSCLKRRYGSTSNRRVGFSEWSCRLNLAAKEERPEQNPWAGMTYEEAMQENNRRIAALSELLRPDARIPSTIERVLATNRSGQLPTLRRLSAESEPAKFGVVWSGTEIASRWLQWAFLSAIFIAIGIGCLYAARTIWRRNT